MNNEQIDKTDYFCVSMKDTFGAIAFALALVALAPLLLAWFIWDKFSGRNFIADVDVGDDLYK